MKKLLFSFAIVAMTMLVMTACSTKSETDGVNDFRRLRSS